MIVGIAAALTAGYGVFLVYTALVLGWSGIGLGPRPAGPRPDRLTCRARRMRAGGANLRRVLLGATTGAASGYLLFGGPLAVAAAGGAGAVLVAVSGREARRHRRSLAADAWPGLLEQLRTLTGAAGRSVPQALVETGREAPEQLRAGFAAAERHWKLTTDFAATLEVLRAELADATADMVCETLAVAYEVGGGGLDARLGELVEDRVAEREARRDARAKQAGVRFARLFVLAVPLGMAAAGISIGTGRAAYDTGGGQVAVVVAIAAVAACWVWSGRLLRLPDEPRVFPGTGRT